MYTYYNCKSLVMYIMGIYCDYYCMRLKKRGVS